MTAKIIASTIQKGGCGKSTCAIHLAFYLAEQGRRVLMVDCDAQGNTTRLFLGDDYGQGGVSELFHPGGRPDIYECFAPNILVLPADDGLKQIDNLRRFPEGAELHFRDNLRRLADEYGVDYVVIDTAPTLQMGMLAPLCASHFSFSPFKPDGLSDAGVSTLLERIEEIRAAQNPDHRYLGLLINLWDRGDRHQDSLVDALQKEQSAHVIPHAIARARSIARLTFLRTPVWTQRDGAARVASRELKAALGWITEQMEHTP